MVRLTAEKSQTGQSWLKCKGCTWQLQPTVEILGHSPSTIPAQSCVQPGLASPYIWLDPRDLMLDCDLLADAHLFIGLPSLISANGFLQAFSAGGGLSSASSFTM